MESDCNIEIGSNVETDCKVKERESQRVLEAAELNFRPVKDEDTPLLKDYFTRYPSRSCDYTVGGVLIWAEYFNYEICEVEDSLIIKGRNPADGNLIFYEPRGPITFDRYLSLVRDYCDRRNEKFSIFVPEAELTEHSDTEVTTTEGYSEEYREYIYDAERMATMSGRKMEKKRNHRNFFINNYAPFEIVDITPDICPELITFTIAFELSHADDPIADYEAKQVIEVLRHYQDYPFDGIVIRKDGKIIGYSFGEYIKDTFVVHAEKGDVEFRGIYQMLASKMSEVAKRKYPDLKYINREDDMGNENLRQSKLSYHPSWYINKKIVK